MPDKHPVIIQFVQLLFLCLLSLCALAKDNHLKLTEEEKQWLKNHPVIKVSNEEDWAPFDFSVDGKAMGYSVDIIRSLAQKAGMQIQFVNGYSWSELVEAFDKGHIDLMHSMTWSEDRAKKYLFSQSFIPWTLSYIVKKNQPFNPDNGFKNLKIAVGRGWATTPIIKQMYPEADFIEFDSSVQMLKDLSTGKVDIGIDNIHTAHYLMGENLITNLQHGGYIDIQTLGLDRLHFAAHKSDPQLISILDKAYQQMTTKEKMYLQDKWFGHLEPDEHSSHSMYDDEKKPHRHHRLYLTPAERQYLEKKKIIRICIDPDWMPLEKFDETGKHIGITADFFKHFQKQLGIPMIPVPTKTWVESLEAARSRKCDIFSLAMETPERKQYMDFTTPYIRLALVVVTKPEVSFFSDVTFLNHKKIGVVKGYAFGEIIRNKYPDIEIVEVENSMDGMDKVVRGELFGFIETITTLTYSLQDKYAGQLKISGKFDETWELGIGTRNDEPLLFGIFEKLIKALSPELTQQIFSRYVVVKYEKTLDIELLVKILAGIIIIFGIIFYNNRKLARLNNQLQNLQRELKEQAHKDPLTGLYNRRYFHDVASKVIKLAQREKKITSVMIIDIDYFKAVNDNFGHQAGDQVIQHLANLFVRHIRDSDIVARFGGEEFVILLPNTSGNGAYIIAENLRKKVASAAVHYKKLTIAITISIGVDSVRSSDSSIDEALGRADQALYLAKKSGRNRTIVYDNKKG